MAVCPECWQQKPLFSERCHHCNTVVKVEDTVSTTAGLFVLRVFGYVLAIFFILALFAG